MFAKLQNWVLAIRIIGLRAVMFNAFARWVIGKAAKRPPNAIIGGPENPYLLRWWLIPRNRWFNVYLHQFKRSDDDRALHDHPWINASIVLTEPKDR